MYEIKLDKEKNRIYIKLAGRISKEDAKLISKEVKEIIMEVNDGFDLINDLTEFKIGDPEANGIAKMLIRFIQNYKPRKVIRIIGKSRIGNAQFDRMITSLNPYPIFYAKDIDEAEELLSKP